MTRVSRLDVGNVTLSRRRALRGLASLAAAASVVSVSGCGRGGSDNAVPPPPPTRVPPAPGTPLWRLQNAVLRAAPPTVATAGITVTQGAAQSADPSIGADALILPTPRGIAVNPNPDTLATLPALWGYRRDTWKQSTIGYIGSAAGNDSWYVPIAQWHDAATLQAFSVCGLHFTLAGRAFEVLLAGTHVQVTLLADGQYVAPGFIETELHAGVPGGPLAAANAYLRFDFGSSATRRISLYAASSQGPCTIAIGKQDTLTPWVRSDEPRFSAIADSYGQARGVNWATGGPFWEAASLLGIPHLDLNALGGTGYAPNNGGNDARNPGNAFVARVAEGVVTAADLLLTAGGVNDNNSVAAPPLYASAGEAKAGFDAAVQRHFRDLRAALPDAVLAAMGPWAPVESFPVDAVAQSKADTILAALRSIAGPWVFLDNLHGGWVTSAGASAPATGRGWQTGTGNVGQPRGDGNGDTYVAADGVHPTPAGCQYLGGVIAAHLGAAILAF